MTPERLQDTLAERLLGAATLLRADGDEWGVCRIIEEAAAALSVRGEPVAFRFRVPFLNDGRWTHWQQMRELHHYGPAGDLVNGAHPSWQVEYAYATPPSEG